MSTHNYEQTPKRKMSSLLITGVLHALALGLGLQATNVINFRQERVIEMTPIAPPPRVEEPLKMPEPTKTLPLPTFIEPPFIPTTFDERAITTVKRDTLEKHDFEPTKSTETGSGKTEIAPPRAPVHIAAQVDSNACEKPEYPASSIRTGEEGTVNLAMLIGPDGRVLESRVEKSSGSRALDKAAVQGLSLCKFKPGSIDGIPEKSWAKLQYVWTIN